LKILAKGIDILNHGWTRMDTDSKSERGFDGISKVTAIQTVGEGLVTPRRRGAFGLAGI
jgi:hypothetical protein